MRGCASALLRNFCKSEVFKNTQARHGYLLTPGETATQPHRQPHSHTATQTATQTNRHTDTHTDTQTHTDTRALTNQALGERGPQHSPASATAQFGEWAYRACRMGENPWQLRAPPDHISDLSRKQLRAMVLSAVAKGNDPHMPSPFLHASSRLGCD